MTEAVQHSLNGMKSTLHVEKLVLNLRRHSLNLLGMSLFIEALQKIQIGHVLVIQGGSDKYNELNLRSLAMQMGMNPGNNWVWPKPKAGLIDEPFFEMGFYASRK